MDRRQSRSPVRRPPTARHDRVLGSQLRIVRELGRGSFGVALLCHKSATPLRMRAGSPVRGSPVGGSAVQFPDQVVVKLTRLAQLAPSEREAVVAEVVLLQKVKHDAVVACLDAWVEDGTSTPYRGYLAIAMAYCESGDLARLIGNYRATGATLPTKDVLSIGAQVAEGLACVHSHKIIHRDVKPGNIFLAGGGRRAVLGDFGVSRQLECTADRAQTYAGTPQYMPPEVVAGRPYDAAADVWALGVVMFEMVVGERPFRSPDPQRAQLAIMTSDPMPLLHGHAAAHPGKCDPGLVDIIGRCLAKDAARRPSASEVATTLKALGGVVPRSPSQPDSPVSPVPVVHRVASPPQPAAKASPVARRAPASPIRIAALRSPSEASAADSPMPLSAVRAGRLSRLRDSVTKHTREGINETTGRRLQAALGSGRLTALVEVTVALYVVDGQERTTQALTTLIAAHRTPQPTSDCVTLALAHYFQ
eukprot:CAMPEP_0174833406 /NCGR_PEP_ID=MMETSP1114-20130205/4213_1 /TAXON_ID=312471 /ORGANISM="Neobodo designis, Strain CCAP 1951/1" /LENGTH=476 /DNA_ID=CAMNT_0016067287 /DNA_START=45 /DNA_END=1475 /DNA_ORIENTATION=+